MANIYDIYSFDLNEGEKVDLAQAIFENFKTKPVIADVSDVITGIKSGDIIPFIGLLEDVGGCLTGCSITEQTAQIPVTNKRWSPVNVGARLAHCERDADKIFNGIRGRMQKAGKWDSTGDPILQVIAQRAEQALQEMILRYAWHGDTSADVVGSGGVLTAGTDTGLFDCVDGLWKQIFDAVPNTASNYVEITENAEATYALQLALDASDGYDILRGLHENADSRLLAQPDAMFLVTRSIYNNWLAYREDQQMVSGAYDTTQVNTRSYGSFRGIPVIVVDFWDRIIRAYEDDGTAYNLPHRAILTVPSNIPIGFVEDDPFSIDPFYDRVSKEVLVDIEVDVDAKLLETYLISVAY